MSGILGALVGGRGTPPLTVTASNVSRTVEGSAASGNVVSIASPNTTITGGVAPYTQNWTLENGADPPNISSATALNPSWSKLVATDDPNLTDWRVTVTDSASATASFVISVSLIWVQV